MGIIMNYHTQMEAAKKGIITKEMESVAEKEYRSAEEIRELVAKGQIVHRGKSTHVWDVDIYAQDDERLIYNQLHRNIDK